VNDMAVFLSKQEGLLFYMCRHGFSSFMSFSVFLIGKYLCRGLTGAHGCLFLWWMFWMNSGSSLASGFHRTTGDSHGAPPLGSSEANVVGREGRVDFSSSVRPTAIGVGLTLFSLAIRSETNS
jgi:hypothetical protein